MPAPAVEVRRVQTPVTIEQLVAGLIRVLDAQGVTYTPEALAAISGVCNAETSYRWIWCWNFGNVDWRPTTGGAFYWYVDSSTKKAHKGVARATLDDGMRPWLYELRRRQGTWAAALRGDTNAMVSDMKRTGYFEKGEANYKRNTADGYRRSIEIARRLFAARPVLPPPPPAIKLEPKIPPTPASGPVVKASTSTGGGALVLALVAAGAVAWLRRR